jgi:sialate O-acetylesterase
MTRRLPFALVALACAGLAGGAGAAAPEPAALFQDHAILQRDKPVPVWGRAAPGEHVVVSFAGQRVGATAGPDGRWIAVLAPLQASASGADMTIAGKDSVTVRDILVGEVWLCAGEGNMEFSVDGGSFAYRVENAVAEVAAARYPLVRQFKVARRAAAAPVDTALGDWSACSPSTVGQFTAVGYFFARDLLARLGVPVGIINCTWSATPLESWMSPSALAGFPGFSNGHPVPGADKEEDDPWVPSSLFNGMVCPLLPFAIRGALWYQGESNVGRAAAYAAQFPALITSWRSHFGDADLPFLWVQLANYAPPGSGSGEPWARLREAQSGALSLPSTGQAVAIDIGEPGSLYPRNKREVGRRLTLIAKAKVYSIPVDFSGPAFVRAEAEGGTMRVHFLYASDGLTASGRPLQSFEVAGADRLFHAAAAAIEDDAVVARSPAVKAPVAVRYAWRNAPEANLYNGAGLPAAPFRSDDW